MGSFSKRVFKKIDSIPEKARIMKFTAGENIAIIRKKKLYNQIKWTPEQQREFNSFWEKHGGIHPYWHKLYQSMNGVFDVRYFPEKLYTTKLEPLLNPWLYSKIFSDKNMIATFWGVLKEVYIPKQYLGCINGSLVNGYNQRTNIQKAIELLSDIGKCIVKPTIDSSSGKGFRILNIKNGTDQISYENVNDIIINSGTDYVIQELVENNDAIKALNPTSLNTIRTITYRVDDQIKCAPLTLRVGVHDSNVDNIHAGGLCVGINQNGTLKEYAYKLGFGDNSQKFLQHPASNVVFKDYYIGDIQRLINSAIKLHERVPYLGIVSWDLTFDKNENVVIIEANCSGQSVWFPQVVNGVSLFGDDTEYLLDLIQKNR